MTPFPAGARVSQRARAAHLEVMHGISPRHLFLARVSQEILQRNVTPEQAVQSVVKQMPSDPVFQKVGAYEPSDAFAKVNFPSGVDARARATELFERTASLNGMSPQQLSQNIGGGLQTAVSQATTGLPPDLTTAVAPKTMGLAKESEPTSFDGWGSYPTAREAMALMLFPKHHSTPGRGSAEYQDTANTIGGGGSWKGDKSMSGQAVVGVYGEFADWALTRQGLPAQPPPADLARCMANAYDLDGQPPAEVKKVLAQELKPGGTPVLIPFDLPGHQTYASFEAHPTQPDKVVMRYFDRQRQDLDVETRSGKVHIPGFLGPDDERRKSTELCFEVDRDKVLHGSFVDDMFRSVAKTSGATEARKSMVDALGPQSDRVYAATDSRPQVAQHGHAINCTWASFEGFLNHVHGDQYKGEVASMREFIVEKHVVPSAYGKYTRAAVTQGVDAALLRAEPGVARESLLRAQKLLA